MEVPFESREVTLKVGIQEAIPAAHGGLVQC